MACVPAERGFEERLDEAQGIFLGVHTRSDRDDVSIVVLASEGSGFVTPGEHRSDAGDLVGGDLFAISRTAKHDSERPSIGDDGFTARDTRGGVMVQRIVGGRPMIDTVASA